MLKFKQANETEAQVEYRSDKREPVSVEDEKGEEQAISCRQEAPQKLLGKKKRRFLLFHPRQLVATRTARVATATLVLATLVAGRWWWATIPPTILTPPKDGAKLTAPNAAHFYQAATDALPQTRAWETFDTLKATTQTKQQVVADAAPAMALLRQGMLYTYSPDSKTNWYSDQYRTVSLSSPVPNYINLRQMARVLKAESELLAAQGKKAEALSAAMDAVRLGQDVARGNVLIDGLIGLLLQQTGMEAALQSTEGLSSLEYRAALQRLSTLVESSPTLEQMLQAEQYSINGSLREMLNFRSGSAMFNLLSISSMESSFIFNFLLLPVQAFWHGNQGLVDLYNRRMDAVRNRAALPYQQAVQRFGEKLPYLPAPLDQMLPKIERAHRQYTRAAARKQVLLARLAVEAYRRDHRGRLPDSLEELTVGQEPYLRSVPADPFSPSGDAPLRYRTGKPYSVGENGKDDLGGDDDTIPLR